MKKSELAHILRAACAIAGLVRADVLPARAELLPGIPAIKRRVIDWLNGFKGGGGEP